MNAKQRTLFDPGPGEGAMTSHQQLVWQAIQDTGELTPILAGRIVHASTGAHPANVTCEWCRSAGRAVLDNLRDRQLVKRRKTGVYQQIFRAVDRGHIPF